MKNLKQMYEQVNKPQEINLSSCMKNSNKSARKEIIQQILCDAFFSIY